jgi:DNA-directed RNA polymerase subunit M/transcription elongation factor TFIIS
MGWIHAAGEWLRLSEHYRGMTDGELIAIARDRSQLTEIAQQILAQELSQRKLTVEPEKQRNPHPCAKDAQEWGTHPVDRKTGDSAHADDPYAADPYVEDRELVELVTVWSLRDALQVEGMLNVAGIPFFIGDEKATSVDSGTLNFSQGVSVKIMRIGWLWAVSALKYYEPKDVPKSEKQEWEREVDVRCPSCRSNDIVFEELVQTANGASPKYRWTCSVCGNEWQDNGVAMEG